MDYALLDQLAQVEVSEDVFVHVVQNVRALLLRRGDLLVHVFVLTVVHCALVLLILCILDYEGVALGNARRNLQLDICFDLFEVGIVCLDLVVEHEIEVLHDHGRLKHN